MALEKVLSEAIIPGCVRKERAWEIISDYAKYPTIIEIVDKVEVLERTEETGLSKWQITIENAPLYWVEKDFFNHHAFQIRFKSIEGDFDAINGRWHITDADASGIKIAFEIEYDLGIPVIEAVLRPILREKMKASMARMVRAIQQHLIAKSSDERRYERRIINRNQTARQNGVAYNLFIANLSPGGMMVSSSAPLLQQGPLQLSIAMLDIATIVSEKEYGRNRIIFSRPLDEEVFSSLAENLLLTGQSVEAPGNLAQEAVVIRSEADMSLQLLELTADSMRLAVQGSEPPSMESFTIGTTTLPLRQVVHDGKRNMVNVYFQNPLNNQQLQQVREYFKAA
jgi:ribosome-associated toxin RatA of RatAB toxin-antitoxin module